MWIKQTKPDKKKIIKKIGFYAFSFVFLFLFISHSMFKGQENRGYWSTPFPHSYTWNEYLNHIYIPVGIPLFLLLLFYFFNERKSKKIVIGICDKCNKSMDKVVEHTKCSCGGEFINIENLKWIEDDSHRKRSNKNY